MRGGRLSLIRPPGARTAGVSLIPWNEQLSQGHNLAFAPDEAVELAGQVTDQSGLSVGAGQLLRCQLGILQQEKVLRGGPVTEAIQSQIDKLQALLQFVVEESGTLLGEQNLPGVCGEQHLGGMEER